MYNVLTFIVVLSTSNSFGQLSFRGAEIDTIYFSSNRSYYLFDKDGTTKGKTARFSLVYSEKEKRFIAGKHTLQTYEYAFGTKKYKSKTKILKNKKYSARNIIVTKLIFALSRNENPEYYLTEDIVKEFKTYLTDKKILEQAKREHLKWQFKRKYSSKDKNEAYFEACKSTDSLKLFLNTQFDTNGYTVVTDCADEIVITVCTKSKNYNFQGKSPNYFKQPWYDLSDLGIVFSPVLNFEINRCLQYLLPDNFLLKNTISDEALFDSYLNWYFEKT